MGSAFDHRDALTGSGHDDVEIGLFDLLECGVDDIFTIDKSHADTGDRSVERNIGDGDCGTCRVDCDDIRCVDLVCGDDCGNNLDLAAEGLVEQRAHRTVDETAYEDLLVLRLGFSLEEASGDLSGGIVLLVVLD